MSALFVAKGRSSSRIAAKFSIVFRISPRYGKILNRNVKTLYITVKNCIRYFAVMQHLGIFDILLKINLGIFDNFSKNNLGIFDKGGNICVYCSL